MSSYRSIIHPKSSSDQFGNLVSDNGSVDAGTTIAQEEIHIGPSTPEWGSKPMDLGRDLRVRKSLTAPVLQLLFSWPLNFHMLSGKSDD